MGEFAKLAAVSIRPAGSLRDSAFARHRSGRPLKRRSPSPRLSMVTRVRRSCPSAAIDDQLGPGNVLRLVGGEEQRRVGEIPGVADAPHRTLLVTSADHLLGAAPCVEL